MCIMTSRSYWGGNSASPLIVNSLLLVKVNLQHTRDELQLVHIFGIGLVSYNMDELERIAVNLSRYL